MQSDGIVLLLPIKHSNVFKKSVFRNVLKSRYEKEVLCTVEDFGDIAHNNQIEPSLKWAWATSRVERDWLKIMQVYEVSHKLGIRRSSSHVCIKVSEHNDIWVEMRNWTVSVNKIIHKTINKNWKNFDILKNFYLMKHFRTLINVYFELSLLHFNMVV